MDLHEETARLPNSRNVVPPVVAFQNAGLPSPSQMARKTGAIKVVQRPTLRRKEFLKIVAGAAVSVPAAHWLVSPDTAEARATPIIRVHSIDFQHTVTNGAVSLTAGVRIVTGAKGVSGAQVTVRFVMPNGAQQQLKSSTGKDGIAKFAVKGQSYGAYSVEVLQVTRAGMVYRPANNVVTRASLTVDEPKPEPPPPPPPPPVPDGQINIREFGVQGDGKTDDASAVQKAIDTVARAGGGTLFFPAGSYLLGSTIWLGSGVFLAGEGRDATVLMSRMNMSAIEAISQSNTGLRNLTLQGINKDATWGYGLFAWETSGLHIENCRFADLPDAAMYMMRVDGVSVVDSEFSRIRLTGIRFAPAGDGFANRNIKVVGSTFLQTNHARVGGHSAIHFHGGEPGCKNEHIWLENNHVESAGIGFGMDDVDHAVVTGNRIIGNGVEGEGIALTGSNNTITNNTISDNFAAGILLWGMAHRSISNNVIAGNTCFDNSQGIAIVCGDAGTVVDNARIENNRCYAEKRESRQQYGFQHYIDGTTEFAWRDVRVTNNDFRGNTRDGFHILPPAQAEFRDNLV